MQRIVMKFGGTSLGDLNRIASVAQRVKKQVDAGNQVCVVVSAMSGVTDQLVAYVEQSAVKKSAVKKSAVKQSLAAYDSCEYDAVLASGEQISAGLLALHLQQFGVHARSWLGWQAGIQTTNAHGRARIEDIDGSVLIDSITQGTVAVVAGFQGVYKDTMRITTLGRGGSDTSAVALAVAIKADRCDIYTDVDGVYTTDPRIVAHARKIDKISFEEMLEMASLGSKVLQTRSVGIAMNHKMPLQVLSSFEDTSGTLITNEDETMEKQVVTGIAIQKAEAHIHIIGLPDSPGVVSKLFTPIGDANINVDMIVQTNSNNGKTTDLTFTIPEGDVHRTLQVIESHQGILGYESVRSNSNIAKVSVVGVGMQSHAGVAQKMFTALAEKNINIKSIATSEIKISVIIERDYVELATRVLHTAYGLE